MRKLTRIIPLLFLFICTVLVVEARADSIVITGGSASVGNFVGGPFTLVGGGSVVRGGFNFGPSSCSPCRAGETVSLNTFNSGLDLRSGAATVNGASYAQLHYDGFLRFDANLVSPNESSSMITVTTPFLFTGSLLGCTTSTITGCRPENFVFSSLLTGQGLATAVFTGFASPTGRLYSLHSVTYTFGPANPVPEPATLTLLGTGLASGIGALRKRRRIKTGEGKTL